MKAIAARSVSSASLELEGQLRAHMTSLQVGNLQLHTHSSALTERVGLHK